MEEEEEVEEEVEEMPIIYSSGNPIFMEIKAGTKEQSILESLDQVLIFYFILFVLLFSYLIILLFDCIFFIIIY